MYRFLGDSLSRMAPPPTPPLQQGERSFLLTRGTPHQPPAGYPPSSHQRVPVSSMVERYAKRDNEPSPNNPIVEQHQAVGYPTQQGHVARAEAYGHTGAQQANTLIPQPVYGRPQTYAASSNGKPAQFHALTQSTVHAPPNPTTAPQWTSGGGNQSQEQSYDKSGPATYLQVPMQAYQQQPYTWPVQVAPSTVSSLANDRSSYRPIASPTRKTRAVGYTDNVIWLQERCREQGADEGAIEILGRIFVNGINLESVMRPLTDAEVENEEFGIGTGKVYTAFLEPTNKEGAPPRWICRLCHSAQTWKHSKDVVRHLRRDHFGLADICEQWYVLTHSLTSEGTNVFPGDAATRSFTRGPS